MTSLRADYVGHATASLQQGRFRCIIDPWLAHRLDRFWVHCPAILEPDWLGTVDAVFLTHHHIDHCHAPSLARLPRGALVILPAQTNGPQYEGSGMGHQVLTWLLRQLGFRSLIHAEPFVPIDVGPWHVTPFPSTVAFPELGYLFESTAGTV